MDASLRELPLTGKNCGATSWTRLSHVPVSTAFIADASLPQKSPHDDHLHAGPYVAGRHAEATTGVKTDLGIYTSYSTPPTDETPKVDHRRKRYELLDAARDILPGERVATCSMFPIPDGPGVKVYGGDNAHFEGVTTCGSVWSCPVCSTRIMEERRVELMDVMSHVKAHGGSAVLVTVTLRNRLGDGLAGLAEDLNDAWSATKKGAAWKRFKERHGVEHDANALEITYGANGWHPHKHVILFTDHEPDDKELEDMQSYLSKRFKSKAADMGRYVSPEWGIDVRAGSEAAGYVAKWGMTDELTGQNAKIGAGMTPFQLLAKAKDGDKQSAALFREYVKATKGKRQLTYSRSLSTLREELAARREAEAEQEADPEPEAEPLAILDAQQFYTVAKQGKLGELLTVAAYGDANVLWKYLYTLGVRRYVGWEEDRRHARETTSVWRGKIYAYGLHDVAGRTEEQLGYVEANAEKFGRRASANAPV